MGLAGLVGKKIFGSIKAIFKHKDGVLVRVNYSQ